MVAQEHIDANREIALSYGTFKVLNFIFPDNKAVWLDVLTNTLNLPVDDSHDPTTACGIGNIAGAVSEGQNTNIT